LKSKLKSKKSLLVFGFPLETFRGGTLFDPERFRGGGGGLQHLKCVFKQKGYSKNDIRRALHPKQKPQLEGGKPNAITMVPDQHVVNNENRRIAEKFNISTISGQKWKTHTGTCKHCLHI